jgi:transposase
VSHPENVSPEELRTVLAAVEGKDATRRVMVALNYVSEDGVTQAELAERYGMSVGWVSRWLTRLERLADEPFEAVVYDESRSGRPAELPPPAREQFFETLRASPPDPAWDAWTVPRAQAHLADEFGVEYSPRHVRRLLREAGLTWSADGDGEPTRTVWRYESRS